MRWTPFILGLGEGIGMLCYIAGGAVAISFGADLDYRHAFAVAFGLALIFRAPSDRREGD